MPVWWNYRGWACTIPVLCSTQRVWKPWGNRAWWYCTGHTAGQLCCSGWGSKNCFCEEKPYSGLSSEMGVESRDRRSAEGAKSLACSRGWLKPMGSHCPSWARQLSPRHTNEGGVTRKRPWANDVIPSVPTSKEKVSVLLHELWCCRPWALSQTKRNIALELGSSAAMLGEHCSNLR